MKGWELLHKLASLSTNELALEVHIEGCDCVGKADSIGIENDELFGTENGVIVIKRDDD